MASNLLRKLSLMGDAAPQKPKTSPVRPKIFDWSCPAEEGLDKLSGDALYMMGYRGKRFDINRAAFIDTETTGLSGGAGTVAFLVGVGFVRDGRFWVRQYLMPDYGAEAEMLDEIEKLLFSFDTAVHFNGRRFDMPLLAERCVMKRRDDFTGRLDQLDLLYPARSVWKLRLGSCRLSCLETQILGMPEREDIPGSEIPSRYFEAVKKGDMSLLDEVIRHNRQDIATMQVLLKRLNDIYAEPEEVFWQQDIFSLGKVFERQGEYRMAKKLYLKASQPRAVLSAQDLRHEKYAGEANLRLYLIERRSGAYDKCELTLKNMIKRRQMEAQALLELCKLYEHRMQRYGDALEICERLIALTDETGMQPLIKRKNRLLAKLQKHGGYCHV